MELGVEKLRATHSCNIFMNNHAPVIHKIKANSMYYITNSEILKNLAEMYLKIIPSHQYANNVITSILLLFFIIPLQKAQEYNTEYFSTCRSNTTFDCGRTRLAIKYPFWGRNRPSYCGLEGYELSCEDDFPVISIGSGERFQVVEINPSTTLLKLESYKFYLQDGKCPSSLENYKLNQDLFSYGVGTVDLYLFVCPDSINANTVGVGNNFACVHYVYDNIYETKQVITGTLSVLQDDLEILYLLCNFTKVPVDKKVLEEFTNNATNNTAAAVLESSFQVDYVINKTACSECEKSGGECWQNTNSADSNSQCLYAQPVLTGKTQKSRLNIGLASGAAGVSILFVLLFLFICYWRKKANNGSSPFSDNVSSYPKDIEAFIRQYGSSTPNRFTYSSLKRITNSFKNELGKGGYGNVFKGTLPDGRLVAVKVLNSSKGNGEEFMNEVASIGRTSHVNVVTLLGFCYEGKRRALIYEYMPNGSLEKFIYRKTPSSQEQHLGWEKLYNIAFGVARGLEYLHNGCNTPILHLDIKPHNILLDEDFCPKISDFGLAKLYTRKQSMVSMMQARGTIGYIAPEVFSRNFGQVSHKSDVYSYGMMILEMVGGTKNIDTGLDRSSEIYFPSWVYKHLESSEELSFANELTKEENELVRKMMIVGLWCIQSNPSQRPSISMVIEMFDGHISPLELPPKPYLYSVPNSPLTSQQKSFSGSSSRIESNSLPKLVRQSNNSS